MNTKNTIRFLFFILLWLGCSKDKVTEELIDETDPYVGTDCIKEWQDLGSFSIMNNSFQYYPYDTFTGKAIVFIDSLGNEKRFIYDTVFHDFLQWGGEKPCPSNSALTERFQWKYESRTLLFQDDRDPYIWRMGIRSVP
ncbi:MAG: hypothetical protein KDC24_12575, partial [Saprospiraceae bacterium]|nr:hypothetical protein [Saprospiraceae bacterium]